MVAGLVADKIIYKKLYDHTGGSHRKENAREAKIVG